MVSYPSANRIDEIHTLVGAGAVGRGGGGGGGGLDISNLMKPALARGDLQVIGATTLDEHRKYVEKDAALERRLVLSFQMRLFPPHPSLVSA